MNTYNAIQIGPFYEQTLYYFISFFISSVLHIQRFMNYCNKIKATGTENETYYNIPYWHRIKMLCRVKDTIEPLSLFSQKQL